MADSSSSRIVPTLSPLGSHKAAAAVPISRPANIFGSRQDIARFHLNSSTVSKMHALLVLEDNNVYIHDLGSRMGVYVNREKVIVADLKDGDEIQIGRFSFRFNANGLACKPSAAPAATLHVSTLHDPVPMHDRVFQIGRRGGSDLEIAHADVSNIHALIFVRNGRRFVRDLHSRTGTWLDGQTIHQEPLNPGAIVKVGPVTINYELDVDLAKPVAKSGPPIVAPPAIAAPIAIPIADAPNVRPPTPVPADRAAPIEVEPLEVETPEVAPLKPPVPLPEDLLDTFAPAPTESAELDLIPLDIDLSEPMTPLATDEIVLADDEDTLAPSSAPFHREPLPDDPNLKIVIEPEAEQDVALPSAKLPVEDEEDGLDLLRRGWHDKPVDDEFADHGSAEAPLTLAEAPAPEKPANTPTESSAILAETPLPETIDLESDTDLLDLAEADTPAAPVTEPMSLESVSDATDESPALIEEDLVADEPVAEAPVIEEPLVQAPAAEHLVEDISSEELAPMVEDKTSSTIELDSEPELESDTDDSDEPRRESSLAGPEASRHSPGMTDTDPLFVDEDEDLSDAPTDDARVNNALVEDAPIEHALTDDTLVGDDIVEIAPSEDSANGVAVDLTQTAFHDPATHDSTSSHRGIDLSDDAIVLEHDELDTIPHTAAPAEVIEPSEPTIESALPPVAPVSLADESTLKSDLPESLSDSFIARSLNELTGADVGLPVEAPDVETELEPETQSNVSVAPHPDDVKDIDDLIEGLDLPTDEELLDISDLMPEAVDDIDDRAEAVAAHKAPPAPVEPPHPDDVKALDDLLDGLDLPEPEPLRDIRDLFPTTEQVMGLTPHTPSEQLVGGSPILNLADFPGLEDYPGGPEALGLKKPAPQAKAPPPVPATAPQPPRPAKPASNGQSKVQTPEIPEYQPGLSPLLTSFSGSRQVEDEKPHLVGFNGGAPAAQPTSPFAGASSNSAATIADVLVGMRAKTSTDVFANPSPVEVTELATDHLGGGLTTPITRNLEPAPAPTSPPVAETAQQRRQRLKEQEEMRMTYERYRPLTEMRGEAPTALTAERSPDAFRPGGQLANAIASTLEHAQGQHRVNARRALLLAILMLVLTPVATIGTYLLSPFGSTIDVTINFDGLDRASPDQQNKFREAQSRAITSDDTVLAARAYLDAKLTADFLTNGRRLSVALAESNEPQWPNPPGSVLHLRMHSRDRNNDVMRLEALARAIIAGNEPLRADRDKLIASNSALQQQLDVYTRDSEKVQNELNTLTGTGDSAPATEELTRLDRARLAAEAALRDAIAHRGEIEQNIAALNRAGSATQPAIPHDDAAIASADKALQELRKQSEATRDQLAALQTQLESKTTDARKKLDAANAEVAITLSNLDKSLAGNDQLQKYVRVAREKYDKAVAREQARIKREEADIEAMRQAQARIAELNDKRVKEARQSDSQLKSLSDNLAIDTRQLNAATAEGLQSEIAGLQMKIKLDKELIQHREDEILKEPVYVEMVTAWQQAIDQRLATIQNDRKITEEANIEDQTELVKLAPPDEQLSAEGKRVSAELQTRLADLRKMQKDFAQLTEDSRKERDLQEAALKKQVEELDVKVAQAEIARQAIQNAKGNDMSDLQRAERVAQLQADLDQARSDEAKARMAASQAMTDLNIRQKLADELKDVTTRRRSLVDDQTRLSQQISQASNQIRTNEIQLRSKIVADPNSHTVVNDEKDRRIPYAASAGGATFALLGIPFLMSLFAMMRAQAPAAISGPGFAPVIADHMDDTLTIDSPEDLMGPADLELLPEPDDQSKK